MCNAGNHGSNTLRYYVMQLGLNVGGGGGSTQEIKLRLRHGSSQKSFLPYTSILGTMLHELCHNHIGPHDQTFYSLLEELRKVCACHDRVSHLSWCSSHKLLRCIDKDLMERSHGIKRSLPKPMSKKIGYCWRRGKHFMHIQPLPWPTQSSMRQF